MEPVHHVLLQLGIVLFTALLLGGIAESLGLPSILGYALAGLLLSSMPIDTTLLKVLADLGITLLLFYIGLEFNIRRLLSSGPQALFLSPIKSGLGFLLGFTAGQLMGLSPEASLVTGAAIAVSSTGIISHYILERRLQHSVESRVVMAMLILEDIFSVLFLSFLLSRGELATNLLNALFLLVLIATVGTYLSRFFFRLVRRLGHEEKLSLYALGLLILFSYGVALLGISPALGAFFAGMALSEAAYISRVERELDMLKRLFVLLFFTSIGLFYTPAFSLKALLLGLLLTLFQLLNMTILGLLAPLVGIPLRSAVRLALLDMPIGEFSLFFAAAAQMAHIPGADTILAAVFLAVVLTVLLSGYLWRHEERFLNLLRHWARIRPGTLRVNQSTTNKHLHSIFLNVLALIGLLYFAATGGRYVAFLSLLLTAIPLYLLSRQLMDVLSRHLEHVVYQLRPGIDYFERRYVARRAGMAAIAFIVLLFFLAILLISRISGLHHMELPAALATASAFLFLIYTLFNLLPGIVER